MTSNRTPWTFLKIREVVQFELDASTRAIAKVAEEFQTNPTQALTYNRLVEKAAEHQVLTRIWAAVDASDADSLRDMIEGLDHVAAQQTAEVFSGSSSSPIVNEVTRQIGCLWRDRWSSGHFGLRQRCIDALPD